jgi:hypothetical protein
LYDTAGVENTHKAERCTFDYIIKKHVLIDPAVLQIAELCAVQIPLILILLNRLRAVGYLCRVIQQFQR